MTHLWTCTLVAAAAFVLRAEGQSFAPAALAQTPALPAPAVRSAPPDDAPAILLMRTAGQPERRLKVLKRSTFPDGDVLVDVQDVASGRNFTLPGQLADRLPRAATSPAVPAAAAAAPPKAPLQPPTPTLVAPASPVAVAPKVELVVEAPAASTPPASPRELPLITSAIPTPTVAPAPSPAPISTGDRWKPIVPGVPPSNPHPPAMPTLPPPR